MLALAHLHPRPYLLPVEGKEGRALAEAVSDDLDFVGVDGQLAGDLLAVKPSEHDGFPLVEGVIGNLFVAGGWRISLDAHLRHAVEPVLGEIGVVVVPCGQVVEPVVV